MAAELLQLHCRKVRIRFVCLLFGYSAMAESDALKQGRVRGCVHATQYNGASDHAR